MGNQIRDKLRDISEAVEAGDKIEAIRIYQEMTRTDLQEATGVIEDLSASLVPGDSEVLPAESGGYCRSYIRCVVLALARIQQRASTQPKHASDAGQPASGVTTI